MSAAVALEAAIAAEPLRDDARARAAQALCGLQAGLGRLRGIGSASAMIDKATEEVCRGCGFDRAILFRVHDGQMVAESVHYTGDPEGAAALLEVGRRTPAELDHLLLETEMVRRRIPLRVDDAQNDPRVHRQIALASGATSYVAAPIMPEGRVIGFLHADRRGRPVDDLDLQLLWAFAEGFGYAFESTVLRERIRAQRAQVRQMIASTGELLDELGRPGAGRTAPPGDAPPRAQPGAPSQLSQLLTAREVDVMRLLATGETNAGIADRLVISEGTVKSHVKHILRKLRAANRAEAVSRYLRIQALDVDG